MIERNDIMAGITSETEPDKALNADSLESDDSTDDPTDDRSWWLQRPDVSPATGIAVLVLGIIGFIASATLTIERIELLINPSYRPPPAMAF